MNEPTTPPSAPTPRTDAVEVTAWNCYKQACEHARQLERELAEARAECFEIKDRHLRLIGTLSNSYPEQIPASERAWSQHVIAELHKERDQLCDELSELRAWKAGKKGVEEYYQVCAERDQLRARVAELEVLSGPAVGNILRSMRTFFKDWREGDFRLEGYPLIHARHMSEKLAEVDAALDAARGARP